MALNRWGFPNEVGLITRTDQIIQKIENINVQVDSTNIENVVNNAISESTADIDAKINEAKTEIIESMPECNCGNDVANCCCVATKCDIKKAVDDIKDHIDSTVNNDDFRTLFSNVNEIYNEILKINP